MNRTLLALVAGTAIFGFSLASPHKAQAQSPFGVRVQFGGTNFGYQQGYGQGYGQSYGQGYGYGGQYDSDRYYGRPVYDHHDHHDYHQGYSHRRAPIVIPEYQHWTPDRGYHGHGTILVPHRGHYHVRDY